MRSVSSLCVVFIGVYQYGILKWLLLILVLEGQLRTVGLLCGCGSTRPSKPLRYTPGLNADVCPRISVLSQYCVPGKFLGGYGLGLLCGTSPYPSGR